MRILSGIVLSTFLLSCSGITPKSKNINDIWVLKKINQKELNVKTLKPISLEFNLAQRRFYGNDGCNDIFGDFNIKGEMLKFKNIASTRMACENMVFSNQYVNLLKKSKYFKIEELRLYLCDGEKNKMLEFLKVD